MVREDLLSDPLTYKKSRNRNVTTTTPPRFDKKQRGKSADRGTYNLGVKIRKLILRLEVLGVGLGNEH